MVGKKCRNKSYEYAIAMEKKESRPYKENTKERNRGGKEKYHGLHGITP